MLTLEGVAIGMMVGCVACVAELKYRDHRKYWPWRNRTDTSGSNRRRDVQSQARACAFATLYEFCGNQACAHFVTEADRERVLAQVHSFLLENRDRLGELHFGAQLFEAGERKIAEVAVQQAVEIFLQV